MFIPGRVRLLSTLLWPLYSVNYGHFSHVPTCLRKTHIGPLPWGWSGPWCAFPLMCLHTLRIVRPFFLRPSTHETTTVIEEHLQTIIYWVIILLLLHLGKLLDDVRILIKVPDGNDNTMASPSCKCGTGSLEMRISLTTSNGLVLGKITVLYGKTRGLRKPTKPKTKKVTKVMMERERENRNWFNWGDPLGHRRWHKAPISLEVTSSLRKFCLWPWSIRGRNVGVGKSAN